MTQQQHAVAVTDRGESPGGGQLLEVRWERIQLSIRVRPRPTAARHDPQVWLRPVGVHAPPLAGRLVRRDESEGTFVAEFNIFAGPDQMPIPAGTWELAIRHEDGASAWRPVSADATVTAAAARDFPYEGGIVKVAPVRPARGTFAIEVTAERRRDPGLAALAIAAQSGRAALRWVRHRTFILFVRACAALPGRGHLVVFTSDSRQAIGGNLALVHDRMVERGLDREYRLRTIFRGSIRARRGLLDRLRLVWLLARADTILLEDYQPAIYLLPPRKGQRIIQLWHAWGAFKTVGYSRIGKPGGPNPYSRVHKNYTHAIVSSTHEIPFYAEAFGLPEDRVVANGTPRMDEFLDPRFQERRRMEALDAVPAARGRKVILFAPTFRGTGARDADYPVEIINVAALHAACEAMDAVILVKLHPFVARAVEIAPEHTDRVIDVSRQAVDVNAFLVLADVLVTDYSSLIFEFAALRRPMLFFAYDLDDYVGGRDFYEPYESFVPGRIVRSFEDLVDALRSEAYDIEKVEPFARRHLPDASGSATDRIIDELILAR